MKNKNNEDSKMIHFSFVLGDVTNFEIIQKIRNHKELEYDSQSDLLRDAVLQFFSESNSSDAKERKEQANARIAEAKANRIEEKESLHLRKLEAETELVERQLGYHNTFDSEPSKEAKKAIKKDIEQKYGFSKPVGHSEQIALKKNFYINKINNSEYCGVCKVCQNFTTNICTTSQEAEGDIELHLESVHNLELYQR